MLQGNTWRKISCNEKKYLSWRIMLEKILHRYLPEEVCKKKFLRKKTDHPCHPPPHAPPHKRQMVDPYRNKRLFFKAGNLLVIKCCYQWGPRKTLEPIITQIPGALSTDQRKVSYGAKPFTDFSVTSREFASTCKEKQWNKHSLRCDKKYKWEILTWVQIIESWSDWGSAKRLTPYFPCADVCGTWSSSMDPIYVSEAKREAKK